MMRRLTYGAAMMAASLMLGACKDSATQPDQSAVSADDYALVLFGTAGAALQSTLGPQAGLAFDGSSGAPPFPDSLALTDAQKTAIGALRSAFQATHQAQLDSLHTIFQSARAAHQAGASRDSIRAILQAARTLGQALQASVEALHQSILAVMTDAQRAWLAAHRPPPPPDMNGHPRRPGG